MKILFINITTNFNNSANTKYPHPRHILPPLDIGYCAALLEKSGHKVSFIDTALGHYSISEVEKEIIENNVDIVVLKPCIMTYRITLELAKEIRARYSSYIICMGPMASTSPDFFVSEKSPVDLCIIGEPEYTLSEVVQELKNGDGTANIAGTAHFYQRLVIESPGELCGSLDSLPFPKHDFFIDRGYSFQYPLQMNSKRKFAAMLTSRGCPYPCLFCSPIKRVSFGKEYRARSASNVADEMELLQSRGVNTVYFIDDLFSYDRNRVELICNEIKARKINITWAAQIRADFSDFKLLVKMREAGCSCVNMGIESANDAVLKMLGKGTTRKEIEKTVKFCRDAGINTVGDFIIGIPQQTRNDLLENLRFAKRMKFDLVEMLLFTPYPGSRAFEKYGNTQDLDRYSDYDNAVASYCGLGIGDLRKARVQFYRSYYLDLRFILAFLFKNRKRIVKNLFSELGFLKNVFLFLIKNNTHSTTAAQIRKK